MRAAGMPAATRVSIIGRRNSRFGTGRVMSQIRMQALRRPRANSASGGAAMGVWNAARTAAAGAASFVILGLRMTCAEAPGGSETGTWPRP